MKSLLLSLALFLICSVHGRTQSYIPIIDTNAHWAVEVVNCFPCSWYYYYYSVGDSVTIDSTTYFPFGDSLLVREDSQRVFVHRDTGEYILYDFNLQVGDSFRVEVYNGPMWVDSFSFKILESIDTVEIGGIQRKRFMFGPDEWNAEIWVEGIGDINRGPMYRFLYPFFETSVDLNCYRYDSEEVYGECYPIGIDEPDMQPEVSLFPTTSHEYIHIQSNVQISQIKIFNMHGELVSIENQNDKVDVSTLLAGMYFTRITTENDLEVVLRFIHP